MQKAGEIKFEGWKLSFGAKLECSHHEGITDLVEFGGGDGEGRGHPGGGDREWLERVQGRLLGRERGLGAAAQQPDEQVVPVQALGRQDQNGGRLQTFKINL